MINFRFHLVSLVAVFLALTVGIVMGATVIDRAIVDGLNGRINSVSRKADANKRESDRLSGEVGRLNEFVGESQQYTVAGRLTNVPIAVIATRGVSVDVVNAQVEALREAGATVHGVLWLESNWALRGTDAETLARALGETTRDPAALREAAWRALATRLEVGVATPQVTPAGTGVPADGLTALVGAGFVKLESIGGGSIDATTFPGANARTVLISGPGFTPGNLLLAGARALSSVGMPTVVGEVFVAAASAPARGSSLAAIRADTSLGPVSTVDDVELTEGRIAVTLAGSDLGRQPAVTGDYGYANGASRALPPFKPLVP